MKNLIQEPRWQWVALIVSFVVGILGVWGFGEVIDLTARTLLGLNEGFSIMPFILPAILLTLSIIIGNAILVYGVFVPRVWMKTLIIIASVVLPCILEVIHLTMICISVMNDFLATQNFN